MGDDSFYGHKITKSGFSIYGLEVKNPCLNIQICKYATENLMEVAYLRNVVQIYVKVEKSYSMCACMHACARPFASQYLSFSILFFPQSHMAA
ncbi:hypothetical protein LguiB_035778 [Lonicera macranthoides]